MVKLSGAPNPSLFLAEFWKGFPAGVPQCTTPLTLSRRLDLSLAQLFLLHFSSALFMEGRVLFALVQSTIGVGSFYWAAILVLAFSYLSPRETWKQWMNRKALEGPSLPAFTFRSILTGSEPVLKSPAGREGAAITGGERTLLEGWDHH